MESTRRFKPPWTLIRENSECYVVRDANGVTLAWLFCRDDTSVTASAPASSHRKKRAGSESDFSRIPEFMTQRQGFHPRGEGHAGAPTGPIMSLWRTPIFASTGTKSIAVQLNSLPFNSTGETIHSDGVWKVYEFTWQMDAILFWDRFEGRWLRGTEFHYPERPANLPSLKPLENWPKFNPRDTR